MNERERYLNTINRRICVGNIREKERKEKKIYVYVVRVICTIVEQKKERKKRTIPDIYESHYNTSAVR